MTRATPVCPWMVASAAAIAVFAAAAPAGAQPPPAVSAPNVMLEGSLGDMKNGFREDFAIFAGGSYTIPIPRMSSFGLQLDATVGISDSVGLGGGGGTLFWRNSQIGLLGLSGSAVSYAGTTVGRFGLKGEYYWNRFTFEGIGGYQFGDSGSCCTVRTPSGAIAWGLANYYVSDNLRGYGGGGHVGDHWAGRIGFEFKTPVRLNVGGLSAFIDGTSSGDTHYALAGVRYRFGAGDKTLIQSDREDNVRSELIPSTIGYRFQF